LIADQERWLWVSGVVLAIVWVISVMRVIWPGIVLPQGWIGRWVCGSGGNEHTHDHKEK
jgi:hypothetical protein